MSFIELSWIAKNCKDTMNYVDFSVSAKTNLYKTPIEAILAGCYEFIIVNIESFDYNYDYHE